MKPILSTHRRAGRISKKMLLFLAVLGAAVVWYFRETNASNTMRTELERKLAEAATASRVTAANALKAAEPERGKLAVVAISKDLLTVALKTAEGIAFTEPTTQLGVKLTAVTVDFGATFPKVKAELVGTWNGRELMLDAEGVLQHELTEKGVQLRFVILGVAPRVSLPSGLKAITSAQLAKQLNDRIPSFDAPLPSAWQFTPEVKPIEDFWVPVVSGKVKLHITVPAIPPINVRWQPVAAFFDKDALRVLARISTTADFSPPQPATIPASAAIPTDAELSSQFASWPGLRAGKSYSAMGLNTDCSP